MKDKFHKSFVGIAIILSIYGCDNQKTNELDNLKNKLYGTWSNNCENTNPLRIRTIRSKASFGSKDSMVVQVYMSNEIFRTSEHKFEINAITQEKIKLTTYLSDVREKDGSSNKKYDVTTESIIHFTDKDYSKYFTTDSVSYYSNFGSEESKNELLGDKLGEDDFEEGKYILQKNGSYKYRRPSPANNSQKMIMERCFN